MSKSIEIIKNASEKLYPLVTRDMSAQTTKKYIKDSLTLEEFDNWKNNEVPRILKNRYDKAEESWLVKDELVFLMDWKLAKGKFRPMLPKLIKSNDADSVKACTQKGIGSFLKLTKELSQNHESLFASLSKYQKGLKTSLKELCELKGVGPATASLILSLLHEITPLAPPFFSDEAFMYYVLDSQRPGTRIKYNVKEYIDEYVPLCVKIFSMDDALSMNAIERGGWALKMYEINRITSLADVELPFEINEENLVSFVDDLEEESKSNVPQKIEKQKIKRESTDKITAQPRKKRQKK